MSWEAAWSTLIDLTWPHVLAHNIALASLEELRVRAATKRISEKYGRELSAARRSVPIGGRR
jgi:hypothetical protein